MPPKTPQKLMALEGWICSKINQWSTYFFQKMSGKPFVATKSLWMLRFLAKTACPHADTCIWIWTASIYKCAGIHHMCEQTQKPFCFQMERQQAPRWKTWSCSKPGSQTETSSCRPFTSRKHLARPLKVIGKGIAHRVPALPVPLKYLHEPEVRTKV